MARSRTLFFSGSMMVLGALALAVVGSSMRNFQADNRSGASNLGNTYEPQGSVDEANASLCQLKGWAADLDQPAAAVTISVFLDQPRRLTGDSGLELGKFSANQPRPEVTEMLQIGGNHGFQVDLRSNAQMPKDGRPHKLYVYALDAVVANEYTLITKTPISLACQ